MTNHERGGGLKVQPEEMADGEKRDLAAREFSAVKDWYLGFKTYDQDPDKNPHTSPYSETEKKLNSFLGAKDYYGSHPSQSTHALLRLDKGMESAFKANDLEVAKKIQTIMQEMYEESRKDVPETDSIANKVADLILARLETFQTTLAKRLDSSARRNELDKVDHDSSYARGLRRKIERGIDQIKKMLADEKPVEGKSIDRARLMASALTLAGEVWQKSGNIPELDVFDFENEPDH